ncbi:MAG: ABC transporter ATP-binding protein [Sphingomonadaceae bacterium]
MGEPILRVSGLTKTYGGVRAVSGVGFTLAPGELVAMIGPNGAGKTTCFNMLDGQVEPDAGSIEIAGRAVIGQKPHEIWRLGVGRTFQITATFGSMTVRENVQMALLSYHRRLRSLTSLARRSYVSEADALLTRVEMREQAGRPCAVLAYGDLKRVELAVALANRPQLLLMDEPTAGMAPRERGELMRMVSGLAGAENMAVLFTEHDMDVVFGHAHRILVLSRGALIAQGKPEDVRADPQVREVYLGSQFDHA